MADNEQHPWIFGLGNEREILIQELNSDSSTPPHPGLEAQNRPQANFAEDYEPLTALFAQLIPEMGNLNQALPISNNGITLFLNLPNVSDIPAHVSPCTICPD